MKNFITRLGRRKALPCKPASLEDPHAEQFLTIPSVRLIARKRRVNPTVAALISELLGISTQVRS
jgi:hypothetical protein